MGRSVNELANVNLTVLEFEQEIQGMGYEDLFTLRTELTMAISRIAAQLDTARAKADESGEPVNRFWYNRAKVAQRFKNQFIQLTEREMGKQRRAEKDQRTATFYEQFMTEARSILDADTFAKITDTAKSATQVPSVVIPTLAMLGAAVTPEVAVVP